MGRCTVYTNCIYFITVIYNIKALLEALSWGGILTINGGKTDPRWDLHIFFLEQLNTSLQNDFLKDQYVDGETKNTFTICNNLKVKKEMLNLKVQVLAIKH